ncbi:PAS domain S-box protein [Opitutus sp. ER46]|uniref:PAS domain S-box protein n=1 Tax=Opitutus sp. ER46 TaxID=2161864 RepID=UPI000D3082D7|nr:PAS domain S-box protein [Opitutus sp. ER46]PTX95509.1 hypothetical protein DB354_08780 [Opitutus sp. ER46]
MVVPNSAAAGSRAPFASARSLQLIPLVILLLGLAGCAVFFVQARNEILRSDAQDFVRLSANAEQAVRRRVETYLDAMNAAAAFLRASTTVERAEWREFVATLDLPSRYPGIRGLVVIYPVPAGQTAAFRQRAQELGAQELTLHGLEGPLAPNADYAIITFAEPEQSNYRILGLDVYSEADRREAALRARDTGQPCMTARLRMANDGLRRYGAALYVPVYRAGTNARTVEERRALHVGWVGAPFIVEEVFEGALAPRAGKLRLEFFEGSGRQRERLIYSSDESSGPIQEPERVQYIELAGQRFTMAWARGREFVVTSQAPVYWTTAGAVLGTLLLTGLLWSIQNTGRRAQRLADKLTQEMAQTQHELEAVTRLQRGVLDASVHAIIATRPDGVITVFNLGAERMLGHQEAEVVGRELPLRFHDPAELSARAAELSAATGRTVTPGFEVFTVVPDRGQVDEREWTYERKDGGHLPVLLSVTAQRNAAGGIAGYLFIAQDLTLRKQAEVALRQSEERLSSVLGHADCLVWEATVMLKPDDWTWRMVVYPSALYRRLLGNREARQEAGLWYHFKIPEQAEMNHRARAAMEEGREGYTQEFRLLDGTETVWLRETVAITREGPTQFWLVGVATDITQGKRAEVAQRASEQRLADVFRSMAEGVVVVVEGKVVECNTAALEMLQLEREQLIGRSLIGPAWQLRGEDGIVLPESEYPSARARRSGEPQRDVVLALRTSGQTERWLSVNTMPVRDEDGAMSAVVVSFIDITRRKLAEAGLVQSQRLLETVLGILPGMVAYWDAGLLCRFSNSEYIDWFGRTAEQMRGMHMRDLLGPELFALNEPYVREVLAGRSQRFERTLTKRDGTVRLTWAQYIPDFDVDQVTVRGFVVLVSDVTEIKQQEAALRASEAKLRESLREVNNLKLALDEHAIVTMTDPQGVITYANEKFCRVTQQSLEEVIGQPYDAVAPAVVSMETHAEVHKLVQQGQVWHGEICHRRQDGTCYWVDATVVPILGDDQKPVHYITVRTDITPRKNLEQSLAVARDQALEASRLKSEFLATMSHEIRTPMNAIIGMAGLLSDTALSPEQADMVRIVSGAAEGLLAIINDILDFSRIEAGQLRLDVGEFDLARVIEDTVKLLEARAREKGIGLRSEFDPPPPARLLGDAGRVRQVLMNLLGNAVKFTVQGEVVVTGTVVSTTPERVRVRVAVKDTGVGIAPEARDRLFRPFVQGDGSTTRRFGGTGLGLAITRQLVVAMGGTIDFESEPGKGSTFTFELEFGGGGTLAAATSAALPPGKRALVVDDNATNRAILVRQLEHCGVEAETVGNGVAALARLRDPAGARIDLLVLDVAMPGMDGWQFVRMLRADAALATVPVVLLSSDDAVDPGEAKALQVVSWARKPVTEEALGRCVARALADRTPVAAEARPAPAVASPRPRRLKVLLVEDNLANQQVASLLLVKLGHDVQIAGDGHQALERLADGEFDVVLMDCQMPELDGYETTRWIRHGQLPGIDPKIPILAVTAYARPEDRRRCVEAGMDGYLSKPVRFDELRTALDAIAGGEPAGNAAREEGRADNPEVIDEVAYETTRALPGTTGESLLPEVIALYLGEEPARLDRLAKLVADRAAKEVAAEAHSFGGGAVVFGGIGVRRASLELEAAARAEDWGQAEDRLARLNAAAEQLRAALRQRGLAT